MRDRIKNLLIALAVVAFFTGYIVERFQDYAQAARVNVDLTTYERTVYPANATGTAVASGAGVIGTWGNWVQVIGNNTVTDDFYISSVSIKNADEVNVSTIQLEIAVGESGSEVARQRFGFQFDYSAGGHTRTEARADLTEPYAVSANSRISARTTDSENGSNSHTVYVEVLHPPS